MAAEDTPSKIGDTERLKSYWTEGKGAAVIAWGVPGDYDRCVVQLSRYLPPGEVHGYCQNMHIRATGHPAGHAPGENGK